MYVKVLTLAAVTGASARSNSRNLRGLQLNQLDEIIANIEAALPNPEETVGQVTGFLTNLFSVENALSTADSVVGCEDIVSACIVGCDQMNTCCHDTDTLESFNECMVDAYAGGALMPDLGQLAGEVLGPEAEAAILSPESAIEGAIDGVVETAANMAADASDGMVDASDIMDAVSAMEEVASNPESNATDYLESAEDILMNLAPQELLDATEGIITCETLESACSEASETVNTIRAEMNATEIAGTDELCAMADACCSGSQATADDFADCVVETAANIAADASDGMVDASDIMDAVEAVEEVATDSEADLEEILSDLIPQEVLDAIQGDDITCDTLKSTCSDAAGAIDGPDEPCAVVNACCSGSQTTAADFADCVVETASDMVTTSEMDDSVLADPLLGLLGVGPFENDYECGVVEDACFDANLPNAVCGPVDECCCNRDTTTDEFNQCMRDELLGAGVAVPTYEEGTDEAAVVSSLVSLATTPEADDNNCGAVKDACELLPSMPICSTVLKCCESCSTTNSQFGKCIGDATVNGALELPNTATSFLPASVENSQLDENNAQKEFAAGALSLTVSLMAVLLI